ncbi:flavin reductase family protein [Chitinophaga lutea]
MAKTYKKADFPVAGIRRFLEPGPIVLVSTHWKGKHNIMTMGWHTVMEFSPSLIGCMITAANHSYGMLEKSGECVINIPEIHLIDEVIGIGNTRGTRVDKFRKFGLTPEPGEVVDAPVIKECYANFECKVADRRMLDKYNFFILECVKAHVPARPKFPKTLHYRGEGIFMLSGRHVAKPELFRPGNI